MSSNLNDDIKILLPKLKNVAKIKEGIKIELYFFPLLKIISDKKQLFLSNEFLVLIFHRRRNILHYCL